MRRIKELEHRLRILEEQYCSSRGVYHDHIKLPTKDGGVGHPYLGDIIMGIIKFLGAEVCFRGYPNSNDLFGVTKIRPYVPIVDNSFPGEKGIVSLEETIRDKLETKRDNKGRMETK